MKEITTEVLICGGGPAGMSCAFTLGKHGIQTVLIDKKKIEKIGDKVCGDALHPELTEEVNLWEGIPLPDPDKKELMQNLDFIVVRGMTEKAEIFIDEPSATVDRLRYGQALMHAADEFDSVTILAESPVREVLVENNTVVGVIVKQKDGLVKINSKLVVDASGTGGIVRGKLPEEMCVKFPRKLPNEDILVAYREILRTKEPHQFNRGMYLIYEKEIIMPGYYWVFSRGEREVNIGLGYYKRPENKGKNIRGINAVIRDKYFKDYEIIDSRGDSIPARLPLESLVANGFMAVGDAGAMVNPLNGEGHGPALYTGVKAAQQIIMAIKANDFTEKALWAYNKWVWQNFGVLHSLGIAIIKFIDTYGFEPFNWMIEKKIITKDDIKTNLDSPNVNLNSTFIKMIKLMRRPRILLGMKKTLSLAGRLQDHARDYPDIEGFDDWKNQLTQLVKEQF